MELHGQAVVVAQLVEPENTHLLKGSFTLAAAVCGIHSGLRQRRDRNFSISA